MAMSDAHVRYMEERLGPIGASLRSYRNATLVEIENSRLMYKHWTASADLSDDAVYPSYVTADYI